MIVLVHEIDYSVNVSRLTFVDVEKSPGRVRKLIKDTFVKNSRTDHISYDESIALSNCYSEQETWMVQPPTNIECVVTWYLF